MQEDETIAGSSDFALRQMRFLLDERSHLEDRRLPSERALAAQLGVGGRRTSLAPPRQRNIHRTSPTAWRSQPGRTLEPDQPARGHGGEAGNRTGVGPARSIEGLQWRSRTTEASCPENRVHRGWRLG